MTRPLLFLAGEFTVTQALVFRRDAWQHTMTGRRLVRNDDGTLRRDNLPGERLRGVLYYASVDDESVRRHNLSLLAETRFPCWPDPSRLLALDDRHEVMRRCVDTRLATDEVQIVQHPEEITIERPFVLKTGNLHRGEGKHLIGSDTRLPDWDGVATAEPFYDGDSVRAFCVTRLDGGVDVYGIGYDNPHTWIKNAAGAELYPYDLPFDLAMHARRVHRHFGLAISGIDYIVGDDGFHFLEFNQFPGLGATEEIAEASSRVLNAAMDQVEAEAAR
jgi:hypothetical protein